MIYPVQDETTDFEFDGPEARGLIQVERGAYGLYIWVNGQCLALVDLFYLSCDDDDEVPVFDRAEKHPAIVLYHPEEDDALGGVHWYKNGDVVLTIERARLMVDRSSKAETLITYRKENNDDD